MNLPLQVYAWFALKCFTTDHSSGGSKGVEGLSSVAQNFRKRSSLKSRDTWWVATWVAYSATTSKKWKHLTDLQLADPTFGKPGGIDILLGVDILVPPAGPVIGPPGSPVTFETELGWVHTG